MSQDISTEKKDKVFRTSITTNLLGPVSLGLEFKTTNKSSVYLYPRYFSYYYLFSKTSVFSFTSEYRFYLGNRKPLNGFYLGPYLKYRYREDSNDQNSFLTKRFYTSASFFGGGMIVGYQKIYRKGFVLNYFAGPGYTFIIDKEEDSQSKGHWNGIILFDFRTGVAIGYAF